MAELAQAEMQGIMLKAVAVIDQALDGDISPVKLRAALGAINAALKVRFASTSRGASTASTTPSPCSGESPRDPDRDARLRSIERARALRMRPCRLGRCAIQFVNSP